MNQPATFQFLLGTGVALTLAACQAPLAPVRADVGTLEIAAREGGIATLPARVTKVVPADGLARPRLRLTIKDDAAPRFQVLALAPTWGVDPLDEAQVTLFSSTVNTTYDPTKHMVTILEDTFSAPAPLQRSATAAFPPLRPGANYVGRVFLRTRAQTGIATMRVAGSATTAPLTLNAGANNLDFTVTTNALENTYSVVSSTNNNVVTGNMITRGDSVVLDTGVAASQPGVDHVDILISGAAYPGGALIKRFVAAQAANWATYTWDTSADNVADTAAYDDAVLVGGAGVATVAGVLEVRAINSNNQTVGSAQFAINVFGRPSVNVRIQ